MDGLDELVREVAKQRRMWEAQGQLASELQDRIEQTPEWADWKQAAEQLAARRAELNAWEERLDQAALQQFAETVERHPHPAVQIKMHPRLDYSRDQAKVYCIQHLPNALKLDTAVFEKAAKVLDLAFVAEELFPRVYVSRDLSEYLEEAS